MPASKVEAILFDLDGTLVDSLQDITDALNQSMIQLGGRAVHSQQVRHWVGRGVTALCRRAKTEINLDAPLNLLVETMRSHYARRCVVHTAPYPNILKMLDLLKSRGVPSAVLTNKPQALAVEILHRLEMLNYFTDVRGPTDETDRKPAPNNALALLKRMSADPSQSYLVGDSWIDIQTARNAAMRSIAVTWGFQDPAELFAAEPDYLVDEPAALAKIFFFGGA